MSEPKQVVSLSGGKDSTAMLLMMLERGEQVDDVFVFDTGMEFPEMYEHLRTLEEYTGMRFTWLRMEPSFEHQMFVRRLKRGKRKGEHGYGWPRPNARWCTTYKTMTIDKHVPDGAVQCIGLAADENRPLDTTKRYPLIEWEVTESDALAYCRERGFTWGGLYERKKRVSCWCCPLQSLEDLRVLREVHPELWTRLADMDALSKNQFRIDYSVEDLERRFASEDKQMEMKFDE